MRRPDDTLDFSKIKRLELQYRRTHLELSAVGSEDINDDAL